MSAKSFIDEVNAVVRLVPALQLSLIGHWTSIVAAVITAVEMLDATGDMVVCDLRLPGRSGPDAIAFLTQRGCRVLATSGVAKPEEILDAIAAGARGFVPKTAPISVLMRAIR